MFHFLSRAGVGLLDFKDYVVETSERAKAAALDNPPLAQRLMGSQLETAWPAALGVLARALNPLHDEIFAASPMNYYWTGYQTEWATDILFKSPASLAALYPALVERAMQHFKSPDVMRFLGKKVNGNFLGELTTSFKDRPEGVRVEHWANGNSIKMYDKAGSVLGVETTIARATDFKVLRPPHDNPDGELIWWPMRKGVADLHRRAELSQRSNERYLDLELLEAISREEFATAGFRNRDLRRLLYRGSDPLPPRQLHRLGARGNRLLRLLRAHGLIKKIAKTHRYQLSQRGRLLTAALRATRDANLRRLLGAAA